MKLVKLAGKTPNVMKNMDTPDRYTDTQSDMSVKSFPSNAAQIAWPDF